jgi:hypothetical protein
MKQKLFIISVFIFLTSYAFAERFDHFDFDKFKAKKIAYITQSINLTPAEAENFWPVYNEFEQKRFSLMDERHSLENKLKEKVEDLTDEKYVELSKKLVSFEKLEGDLFLEYNDKFLKILPPKKVVLLYVAEMEFKSSLIKELKNGEHDKPLEK